ncbi:MAG TPA: glycosyltransferase family 1 protein [Kiritimatiellia bacterium]|nr:glycosyltransferase family 1 protein [Kiritimatiellia bacterium]
MSAKVKLLCPRPSTEPGSMAAHAAMVEEALALAGVRTVERIPFYHPKGGTVWRHHAWRAVHAERLFASAGPDDRIHMLDGSLAGFIPKSWRGRTWITLHDFIPVLQGRGEVAGPVPSWPARWILQRMLDAVRDAGGVCAISGQTACDAERLTGRAEVEVIPLPVRPVLVDYARRELLPPDVPRPYLLHIGHNAAYKNRNGAIEIFSRLRAESSLHLVMAGPPPDERTRSRADEVGNVLFISGAGDEQLARLYQHAELLLFPSLYEGLGLPVIEAFALGCPVVCSHGGALAEVAGGAALTASVDDVEGMAGHCRRLLGDRDARVELVERGRARVAGYGLLEFGRKLRGWYRL